MCSFLVTSYLILNLLYVNYFLRFRGPDRTDIVSLNGFHFCHNLLHITGAITPQPFVSADRSVVCVYNGEIYNHQDFGTFNSDGEALLEAYRRHGTSFPRFLDGEFALVLVDFAQGIMVISTDVFSTKPVWYGVQDGEITIASYESALARLGIRSRNKVPANTTLILGLGDYRLLHTATVHDFDLTQFKTTFTDWRTAFDLAIRKRALGTRCPVFVCLSSGYDSGCIVASLQRQRIPYVTYTIVASEDPDVLRRRLERDPGKGTVIDLSRADFEVARRRLKTKCEEFIYKRTPEDVTGDRMTDDPASAGLYHICSLARTNSQRIFLSGQGADELYSDYGFGGRKIFDHSGFGGLYPDDLRDVFPLAGPSKWYSFYEGTMSSYMAKEEHVSGCHGIEGRYPFLDKALVQEFLWLCPTLKNSQYKAPLHDYLTDCGYPFDVGKKIGFSAGQNLVPVSLIDRGQIHREVAYCYLIPIPEHASTGDTVVARQLSRLRLWEDDVELGPGHSLHDDIRRLGRGRFSHWGDTLYFSSSDGSDPTTNGRAYIISERGTLLPTSPPMSRASKRLRDYLETARHIITGPRLVEGTVDTFHTLHDTVVLTCYFNMRKDPQRDLFQKVDDFEYIRPWYESMVRVGLHGIIFYDNLSAEFVSRYQTERIIFRRAVYGDYSLNDERFYIYYLYLMANPYKRVFMTDVSDVVVKKDPATLITGTGIGTGTLYLGSDETPLLRDSPWCRIKTKELFTLLKKREPKIFHIEDSFLANPCYNAGVIGASYEVVISLLRRMIVLFEEADSEGNNNMMVLNLVLYLTCPPIVYGAPVTSPYKRYDSTADVYFVHK